MLCKQLPIASITIQTNALIEQTHSIHCACGIHTKKNKSTQTKYNRFPYIPFNTFLFFSFLFIFFPFFSPHSALRTPSNVVILWFIQMKLCFIIFVQFELCAQLKFGAHLFFMHVAPSPNDQNWNFHE